MRRNMRWYDYFGTLYNLAVHTIDQVVSMFGMPERTNFDVRSIHHLGKADDYYDLEFFTETARRRSIPVCA